MPRGRITITLNLNEKSALLKLANFERRDPRDQAAMIIRQSLERLGWLQPATPAPTNQGAINDNT